MFSGLSNEKFPDSLTVLYLNLLFDVSESGERCLADSGTRCKDQELLEGLHVFEGRLACLLGQVFSWRWHRDGGWQTHLEAKH